MQSICNNCLLSFGSELYRCEKREGRLVFDLFKGHVVILRAAQYSAQSSRHSSNSRWVQTTQTRFLLLSTQTLHLYMCRGIACSWNRQFQPWLQLEDVKSEFRPIQSQVYAHVQVVQKKVKVSISCQLFLAYFTCQVHRPGVH